MFCPQCGNESSERQHYCRSCGANLRVIGRVVTIRDAISNRDILPTVKGKIIHAADKVSRAMKKMNTIFTRYWAEHSRKSRWRKQKTAEDRREGHLTKGAIKFFSGGGLSLFLYFLTHALELKLPADFVAQVPFAIDPLVRVFWLIGLIPMLSGIGHIVAEIKIRSQPVSEMEAAPMTIDPPTFDAADTTPEPLSVRAVPRV